MIKPIHAAPSRDTDGVELRGSRVLTAATVVYLATSVFALLALGAATAVLPGRADAALPWRLTAVVLVWIAALLMLLRVGWLNPTLRVDRTGVTIRQSLPPRELAFAWRDYAALEVRERTLVAVPVAGAPRPSLWRLPHVYRRRFGGIAVCRTWAFRVTPRQLTAVLRHFGPAQG